MYVATIELLKGHPIEVGPTESPDVAAALATATLNTLKLEDDRVVRVTVGQVVSGVDHARHQLGRELSSFVYNSSRIVAIVMTVIARYQEQLDETLAAKLGADLVEALTDPTDAETRRAFDSFAELTDFRRKVQKLVRERARSRPGVITSDVHLLAILDEIIPKAGS